MRIRRSTDEEERALTMPTKTVRIRSGPLVAYAEMGSGRAKERTDWFIADEEVEELMRERKAVEVRP